LTLLYDMHTLICASKGVILWLVPVSLENK